MSQKSNPATKILAMTNDEIRAAIGADPEKFALLKKIASLTEQQARMFVDIWTRVQAGEDIDAVIAELRKERKT